MLRLNAVLSAFVVLTLAACTPGATTETSNPPATAGDEAVCREFAGRLREMGSTLIRAAGVLADPAADAGQSQKAIDDIKAEVTRLRSWVDTQLPGIANPQVKSAFDGLRMELAVTLSNLGAAGGDGDKVMESVTAERLSAAEETVHAACGRRSAAPTTSAG